MSLHANDIELQAVKIIVYEELQTFNKNITSALDEAQSEIFKRLDAILKELKLIREEQIVLGHRVNTHDKRLNRVENELQLEPISETL